jgi:dephospho-CoA kinase
MSRRQAYAVGLTGGIAAGKSAVARRFEALGVPVHDADVAARAVVEPGSDGLAAIVAVFGKQALDANGRLDRPAMRRRVFADAAAKQQLEIIVHPRVREWLHQRVMAERAPYCLLAIPLLAENIAHYRWLDRILLVDVPEAVQIERLCARDGIDRALAERMLAHQASRAQRLALADDIVDNSGSEAALEAHVLALHRRYLALAAGQ